MLFLLHFSQIIEKFFEVRVACPMFKPNSLLGLARMLSTPLYVLKDFVQIMKLDLVSFINCIFPPIKKKKLSKI